MSCFHLVRISVCTVPHDVGTWDRVESSEAIVQDSATPAVMCTSVTWPPAGSGVMSRLLIQGPCLSGKGLGCSHLTGRDALTPVYEVQSPVLTNSPGETVSYLRFISALTFFSAFCISPVSPSVERKGKTNYYLKFFTLWSSHFLSVFSKNLFLVAASF